MVRRDCIFTQPLAQLPCDPLRHPPRVHEHERRLVLLDERREPIVVLAPDLVRHHGVERRLRRFDGEIHRAAMAFVDDGGAWPLGSDEVSCDLLHRALCRREPDAQQRRIGDLLQSLERQRQVGAPPGADDGVDFVHDDRARRAEHVATPARRQEQIERLGGCHQNVRRTAQHRRAFGRGRIASAHGDGDSRRVEAKRLGRLSNPSPRLGQVLVDVGAERLERRDVDDPHFVGYWMLEAFAKQLVQCREECRQGLARAGGCSNKRVAALTDDGPALGLRRRRDAERAGEPGGDGGVEDHKVPEVPRVPKVPRVLVHEAGFNGGLRALVSSICV